MKNKTSILKIFFKNSTIEIKYLNKSYRTIIEIMEEVSKIGNI